MEPGPGSPPPPPEPSPAALAGIPTTLAEAEAMVARAGAREFYSIAGFSALNSALVWFLPRFGIVFVVGLGITLEIDNWCRRQTPDAKVLALVLDGCCAGVFVGIGWLAGRGLPWAFVLGMLLYAADGAWCAVRASQGYSAHWLMVAFHVVLLWPIFGRWRALRALQARRAPAAPPAEGRDPTFR